MVVVFFFHFLLTLSSSGSVSHGNVLIVCCTHSCSVSESSILSKLKYRHLCVVHIDFKRADCLRRRNHFRNSQNKHSIFTRSAVQLHNYYSSFFYWAFPGLFRCTNDPTIFFYATQLFRRIPFFSRPLRHAMHFNCVSIFSVNIVLLKIKYISCTFWRQPFWLRKSAVLLFLGDWHLCVSVCVSKAAHAMISNTVTCKLKINQWNINFYCIK